jgi:hypothetical protein
MFAVREAALSLRKAAHAGPVTSPVFDLAGVVSASADWLLFTALPAGKPYVRHQSRRSFQFPAWVMCMRV